MTCDNELANDWACCSGRNASYITIIIITSIPKSSMGNLKDKNFFGGASSKDLMAVLDSQVWENFLTRYCNKKLCLRLASEKFVLAIYSESNL